MQYEPSLKIVAHNLPFTSKCMKASVKSFDGLSTDLEVGQANFFKADSPACFLLVNNRY